MNYLEIALANAQRGYPQFPTQRENKRPKPGFTDWENNATTDPGQIRAWWNEGDWLPAVPPGRVGMAVIDVDRHPGQPDGFEILDAEGVVLKSQVFGTSISGNGTHFWHRHDVGSLNGVLTSVDRKARGGYVVVPYLLPDPSEIVEPLPEKLAGGVSSANVERNAMSGRQLNIWLKDVGAGEPDDDMWEVVDKFLPRGNQQMSVLVARAVSLASQGHPGANYALDRMQEIWLSGVHNSGDPEEEFYANVKSAIEKFGEPIPDTSVEDKFKSLVNPPAPAVDAEALRDSLLQHCINYRSDFLHLLGTNQRVHDAFVKCDNIAKSIKPEENERAEQWRIAATAAMRRVLDREQASDN